MVGCFPFFLYWQTFKGKQSDTWKKSELTDILQIGNSASENREYELKLTLGGKSWPNTVGERASQAISKLRDQGELDHLIIFLEAVPNIWRQIEFAARNFSTSGRIWASLKKKKKNLWIGGKTSDEILTPDNISLNSSSFSEDLLNYSD